MDYFSAVRVFSQNFWLGELAFGGWFFGPCRGWSQMGGRLTLEMESDEGDLEKLSAEVKNAPYSKIKSKFWCFKHTFLMQFWAKKYSKLREKWGKIFEIFRDKTQLGGDRPWSKSGDCGWLEGTGKIFWGDPQSPQEKTLYISPWHLFLHLTGVKYQHITRQAEPGYSITHEYVHLLQLS